MKRRLNRWMGILLTGMLLATMVCVPLSTNAQTVFEKDEPAGRIISQTVETLAGGLTVTSTVVQYDGDNSQIATAATTKTISGSHTLTVKDGSEVFFTFTVKGTFSVNVGVSATCTSSSYTYSISNSSWKFDSATASRSGNTAIADGKFVKKALFITLDTYNLRATLSCDKNGNLTGA